MTSLCYCGAFFYLGFLGFALSLSETTTTGNRLTTSLPLNTTLTNLKNNATIQDGSWLHAMKDTAMLKRGMYVLIAVTLIIVLYFGVKTYRSRSRSTRSYGLLASRGETIELNPLNSDSEDDYTVFEAKKLHY